MSVLWSSSTRCRDPVLQNLCETQWGIMCSAVCPLERQGQSQTAEQSWCDIDCNSSSQERGVGTLPWNERWDPSATWEVWFWCFGNLRPCPQLFQQLRREGLGIESVCICSFPRRWINKEGHLVSLHHALFWASLDSTGATLLVPFKLFCPFINLWFLCLFILLLYSLSDHPGKAKNRTPSLNIWKSKKDTILN